MSISASFIDDILINNKKLDFIIMKKESDKELVESMLNYYLGILLFSGHDYRILDNDDLKIDRDMQQDTTQCGKIIKWMKKNNIEIDINEYLENTKKFKKIVNKNVKKLLKMEKTEEIEIELEKEVEIVFE